MANPRKRNGKWHARYKDASGAWREPALPAKTAAEAKEQNAELQRKARAAALGLERMELPPCVEEVYGSYAKVAKREGGWSAKESRFRLYILPRFGKHRLHTITPANVEELMGELQSEAPPKWWPQGKRWTPLSPQSADHCRVHIAALYTYATQRAQVYHGQNPGRLARKADIPVRPPRFLELPDLVVVLEQVPARWRNFFGTCAMTGLRMGEAKALLVHDVDLQRRQMAIYKSNARKVAKGRQQGHGDFRMVPIGLDAMPFVVGALKEAKSEWLFSDDRGRQLPASKSFVPMLRQALIKAGLVVGYDLRCVVRKPASGGRHGRSKLTEAQAKEMRQRFAAGATRKQLAEDFKVSTRAVHKVVRGQSWTKPNTVGCGYAERRATADKEACPKCGRLMLAKPVPVDFVFHNLRSTMATHLVAASGDHRAAQEILRQLDPKTTDRYVAMSSGRLLAVADLLRLPAPKTEPETATESAQPAPKNVTELGGIGRNDEEQEEQKAQQTAEVGK